MAILALRTQLKTGSIPIVETRGNQQAYLNGKNIKDLAAPYVLIYNDFSVNPYYTIVNTVDSYVIDVHFPVGNVELLNDYVENEIPVLLHRQRLTDSDAYVFQVLVTMNMSFMSEPNDDRSISGGNDDNTISRWRKIIIPRRGL